MLVECPCGAEWGSALDVGCAGQLFELECPSCAAALEVCLWPGARPIQALSKQIAVEARVHGHPHAKNGAPAAVRTILGAPMVIERAAD